MARLVSPFQWIDGKHLDLICEHLEAVESGDITRLIINIPPGYAKSYLCSRVFPAWCLLRHCDWEILLNSYGDDLAQEHSAAARQFYTYWAPKISGASVSTASKAIDRWLVDAGPAFLGGGMRACGINSAVTGRRANVAIVDDPYKNWAEASSAAYRKTVSDNYRSAVRNRLLPGGRLVLIHTRWHKEDLTGELVAEMEAGAGEKFTVLKLAVRAGVDDVLGRPAGEVLWPEFYDEAEVVEIQKALSVTPYFWQSQYQQEPEEPGGKLFKRDWLLYFDVEGDYYCLHGRDGDLRYHRGECMCFQTVDTNGSSKSSADFFVISTWMLCPGGELLLCGLFRERLDVSGHLGALEDAYAAWTPAFQAVENKTFGTNLIAAALAVGLPVVESPADVDKLTRSVTILTKYKSGTVYHRKGAHWTEVVEHELMEFPGGRNDDIVDTASIAGIQSVEFGVGLSELPTLGGDKRVGSSFGVEESLFGVKGSSGGEV